MQKPIFFDNQIVQPHNVDFVSSSAEKAINENFATLFNGNPGIADGLTMTGNPGNGFFTISPGVGYTSDGERVQAYTGTNFGISWTGTRSIYMNYITVNYNPDPSINPTQSINTSINPVDGLAYPTESYLFPSFSLVSGTNSINLGEVTATSLNQFSASSTSGTQYLMIAGFLNLKTNTFDGGNIDAGTLDSNLFSNPLNYDIYLASGTDIKNVQSGVNNLGTADEPFAGVYSDKVKTHLLEGYSPIVVSGGGFLLKSGSTISSDPFDKIVIDGDGYGVEIGGNLSISSIGPKTASGALSVTTNDGTLLLSSNGGSISFTASSLEISSTQLNINSQLNLNENMIPAGGINIGTTFSRLSTLWAENVESNGTINGAQLNAVLVGSNTRPVEKIYTNEIVILGTGSASGTTVITPDVALYWPLYFRR